MTTHGGYDPDPFFDEAFETADRPRGSYRHLADWLAGLTSSELDRLGDLRDNLFRTQGITFTVYGDAEGIERTWPMDLFPRVISASEWEPIEAGLVQRVKALNLFLDDLYVGEQAALHDGIVPRWLVTSSDGFRREAFGISVPHAARCTVAGVDLVRDGEGVFRVLEDNVRTPSGISYVLENRAVMTRVLPAVFRDHQVRPVDSYDQLLLQTLRSIAPVSAGESPTVVVLTPGVHNSAYYEHSFLARQMGVELVEGRDLVVDDHVVFMRTTHGWSGSTWSTGESTTTSSTPWCSIPARCSGFPGSSGQHEQAT